MTFDRPTTTVQPAPAPPLRPAAPTASGGSPGSIERLVFTPAASAWPDGGAPLARWLRSNPDALGDLLGITLTASDEELPGVDGVVLKDPDGHPVLVTVELGASSEQHRRTIWIADAQRDDESVLEPAQRCPRTRGINL